MPGHLSNKLPEGIDSNVGSVGGKLSGGQKQRIAIARALIRNPDLLIFDEATSALDNESEKKVQQAIESIQGQNITKVVIAHRLTTIQDADTIIVLEDGVIKERGNHEALIRLNGTYADLTKIQTAADQTKTIHALSKVELAAHRAEDDTEGDIEQGDDIEEDIKLTDEGSNSIRISLDEEELENELGFWIVMKRIYAYITPKYLIPVIIICATIVGGGLTMVTYPQVKLLIRFINDDGGDDIKEGVAIYIPIIVGMGTFMFFLQMFTRAMLHIVNSNLIENVRSSVYDRLIHQPMEFYDNKNNSVGSLTAILASNVRELNGASIEIYVFMYGACAGMFSGIILAFIFEWNFGLLLCGITPVSALACGMTFALQFGSQSGPSNSEKLQEKMVSDFVLNHSTVSSLANEDVIINRYYANQEVKEGEDKTSYQLTSANINEAFFPALT